jgi:hypothetical protein
VRVYRVFAIMAAALACLPSGADAQEKGKIGAFMGYPSLGLLWHATEKVAVRPEISFSTGSGETTATKNDSSAIGAGATVLFYMAKRDSAAMYIAPRFAYTHSSTETQSDLILPGVVIDLTGSQSALTFESNSNSWQFSGSFGAQYWFGSRFSVFGEAGLAYTNGSVEGGSSLSTSKSDSHSFGTRSSVAAVFYF